MTRIASPRTDKNRLKPTFRDSDEVDGAAPHILKRAVHHHGLGEGSQYARQEGGDQGHDGDTGRVGGVGSTERRESHCRCRCYGHDHREHQEIAAKQGKGAVEDPADAEIALGGG